MIYIIYMYVCLSMGNPYQKYVCQKMRGQDYVAQTRACSKSVFGRFKANRASETEEQRKKKG